MIVAMALLIAFAASQSTACLISDEPMQETQQAEQQIELLIIEDIIIYEMMMS